MDKQDYEDRARRIAENIDDARRARKKAQDLIDELMLEEAALHDNWMAQQRSGTGYPYKQGDIVHFRKATLPVNRTRDYEVTEVTPDKVYLETDGNLSSFTHEKAEEIGIFVVSEEGL